MESFDKLLKQVTDLTGDVAKAEAGNESAGTRVRLGMQKVKQSAQNVREEILNMRRAAPNPPQKGGN